MAFPTMISQEECWLTEPGMPAARQSPFPSPTWKSANGLPAAMGNWELGLCWLSNQQFRFSCKLSKCTVLQSGQRSGCSLHHPPGISCRGCFVLQLNSRCLAQNLRGVWVLGRFWESAQDSGLRSWSFSTRFISPRAWSLSL